MDKSTLSNYGWIIIVTLILAVMLALATPFGTYVGDGVVAVANSFVQSADSAMDEDNIDTMKSQWEGKLDYSAFEDDNAVSLNHSGVIPEGGRYVTNAILASDATPRDGYKYDYADSITLTVGEQFPETPQSGDIYYYGNYAYIFNGIMGNFHEPCDEYQAAYNDIDGWCVTSMMYNGTNPGEILTSVAGKNIKSLRYCFYNRSGTCTIEILPQIPTTVTDICGFLGEYTSSNLRTYAGSTDPDGDFSNYKIPDGVTDMNSAFSGCTALIVAPKIPNGVTDMSYVFSDCTSLVIAPEIPNGVTNMYCTFSGCTSLTTAPKIPASVTNMFFTFYNCPNLTGTIIIDANPTSYDSCFYLYSPGKDIVLTGSSTKLQALANTSISDKRTITIQ